MATKTIIPTQTTATAAEMDGWLHDQPAREWQREQMQFAAMAFLGMCRHAYLSADWIAHNELWASACNSLSRVISGRDEGGHDKLLTDRLRLTYEARGFKVEWLSHDRP